jgi:hypothetical protein
MNNTNISKSYIFYTLFEDNTMHTLPQTHGAILGGGDTVGSGMLEIEWRTPTSLTIRSVASLPDQ